jgi:polysaccharide pyruvyl transferase WcaK-like protein
MKIGLLDHMGYGNLGDAATQEALIANIKKRLPDAEIVGFSLNPNDTRKRHGIICYSITHWHPGLDISGPASADAMNLRSRLKSIAKEIPVVSKMAKRALYLVRELTHLARSFKVLRSLDSLVIAGGGQLSELWRGPWSHPYNVFKFSVLTKLAGRKLVFLNVGAGPLRSRLGKSFIKCSVYLADYVSLRDVESQALIRQLGVKRMTHVFPDSAYALDVSTYKNINIEKEYKPLVGINPIGFCDPRIWPKQDKSAYLRYLDNLAEFLLWLLSQGYKLRIFSGEVSVDVYALEDIKERLQDILSSNDTEEMFVPPSVGVKDLLVEMSRLDFIVTSKFHGVVFSHLLAKPVIALSYHNKIDDLMRTVGHDQYCQSIDNFDVKHLQEVFMSLVESTQDLKLLFRQKTCSSATLLKAQFDELFIPDNLELYSRASEVNDNGTIVRSSI